MSACTLDKWLVPQEGFSVFLKEGSTSPVHSFVCVRDTEGRQLPDCAVKHVLLHELAHAFNAESVGHDRFFQRTLNRLGRCVQDHQHDRACPEPPGQKKRNRGPPPLNVPPDYNVACRGRSSSAGR